MPYQPTNPYLPYGNMRSSKTGSRAVAGMAPQPAYPDFSGIGSLPNFPGPGPHAPTSLAGGLTQPVIDGRNLDVMPQRQLGVRQPLQGQAQAVRTAPLQGGLGKVMANGYEIGTTGINQLKTHGLRAVPAADSVDSLYGNYRGGRSMARKIQEAQMAAPGPDMITQEDKLREPDSQYDPRYFQKERDFAARHGGRLQSASDRFDNIIQDKRGGGNYLDAAFVTDHNIGPNDPRYVPMLLHGPQKMPANPYIDMTDGGNHIIGLGHDKLYDENGRPRPRTDLEPLPGEDPGYQDYPLPRNYPQPEPVQQQLPEELTAQALPMDQVVNSDGFGLRVPQMDDSMPGDNGFGPLPADLENPFQDVSNDVSRPTGLTREDDLNNGFDPQDPYQQYAMPQYSNQGDPFYKGVNNVAMDGLDNKQRFDKMRWADWNRDNVERGWDEFAGSILTPLGAAFAKDPNVRARMQQSAQGQLGRYNQQRQLRNSERGQQFNEDKYYTDLRQDNDPNSYPNWLAGQNATTNRINSATGVTNARSNQQYRQDMIDNRQDETARKQAWDQWRMQNGDTMESRRMFESMYKQNQGQQRIDNQQSQFTQKQSQQDAQFQRAQALREQQAAQQMRESQARITRAAQSGDAGALKLELERQKMIMEANRRDKDGNFIYPDETAAAVGAERTEEPAPEKKPSMLESLFGAKPKAEAAAAPAKKSITAGLSKTEPKQFDRNNENHKALVQEARAKFGDNVAQAKAWLRAKGLKV